MIDLDRVSDVELLRTVAKVQDAEIRRLHSVVEQLAIAKGKDAEAQLAMLREELADRYSKSFGGGSERRPREKPDKDRAPQKGHGPKAQPELFVEEVIHKLDEGDLGCPDCGGDLKARSGQFVESEEIDVVEIQYVLKKHRRQKYRCCRCSHEEVALGPEKLIAGGRYSLDFAVHAVIAKFGDAMPLERQVKRMRRAGLDVTSQALWDQSWALCCLFQNAVERLHQHLLQQPLFLSPILISKDTFVVR